MFVTKSLVERRSVLFSTMVVGIVIILAMPLVVPHLLHDFHIAHIFLHVGGIGLASFITLLSGIAYSRLRTRRLLLSTAAFATFIAAEIVMLVDVTWPTIYNIGGVPFSEAGHLLTFATLGLLALGVFRND